MLTLSLNELRIGAFLSVWSLNVGTVVPPGTTLAWFVGTNNWPEGAFNDFTLLHSELSKLPKLNTSIEN